MFLNPREARNGKEQRLAPYGEPLVEVFLPALNLQSVEMSSKFDDPLDVTGYHS